MKIQTCIWNGTTATVYHLDQGEKVGRHRHDVEHATMVLTGRSKVEIFGGIQSLSPLTMDSRSPAAELPRGIDHEITALEDATIVMNMTAGEYPQPDLSEPGQAGVALV